MRTWMLATLALLLGLPAAAVAHDEAKTPITPLDHPRHDAPPAAHARSRASTNRCARARPAAREPALEHEVQPDGSVRYGNTTVIIRHDCPPGGSFFEPPPPPGRRR